MTRFFVPILAFVCAGLCVSCQERSRNQQGQTDAGISEDQQILAVIGQRSITLDEFVAELNRREETSGRRFSTLEQKQSLLDELIRFEVALAKAKEAGYDRDPEVIAQHNRLIVGRFLADHLDPLARPEISDEEIRVLYDTHSDRYALPETVRASIIYIGCSPQASPEKRTEIRRKAESLLVSARTANPAEFRSLVQQHSEDQPTRYTGGDTGWITRNAALTRWGPRVVNAAFDLEQPGDFAPLVETERGIYIVRLQEKRPASTRPLAEVAGQIRRELALQRARQQESEFYQKLRDGLTLHSNPALLDSISSDENLAKTAVPRMPGPGS